MQTTKSQQAGERTRKGSYVLNRKYAPVGANLVEFEMNGDMVRINYAQWRKGTDQELATLRSILCGTSPAFIQ